MGNWFIKELLMIRFPLVVKSFCLFNLKHEEINMRMSFETVNVHYCE